MNVDEMEAIDIQAELKNRGVKIHHKTGIVKLQETLKSVLDGTYVAPEPVDPTAKDNATIASKTETDKVPTKVEIKPLNELTKTERAMRLVRIVVSPNDPLMSSYPGLIFTVGSSAVNQGRMIKKYVPFNNDEGWHVPQIIHDQIEAAEMQKFKVVKMPNGEKGLKAYITKKFNVQVLAPLTHKELTDLATAQASRGGV